MNARRPSVTADDVKAAILSIRRDGEVASQRAVQEMTGGSFSTIRRLFAELHASGQINTEPTRQWLLVACLIRRNEQVDALLEWASAVQAVADTHDMPLPPLPDCAGVDILGSATWPWPWPADSATGPEPPVVVPDADDPSNIAQPAVGSHSSSDARPDSANPYPAQLYVGEHSTCNEPAQVGEGNSGTGAARGSSRRAPPHATPDGGERSSP